MELEEEVDLRMTCIDVIKNNIGIMNMTEHIALDRAEWRHKIHVACPNDLGLRLGFVWFGLPGSLVFIHY